MGVATEVAQNYYSNKEEVVACLESYQASCANHDTWMEANLKEASIGPLEVEVDSFFTFEVVVLTSIHSKAVVAVVDVNAQEACHSFSNVDLSH